MSKTIERGVACEGSVVHTVSILIGIIGAQAKLSSLNLWHKTIKNLYGFTNPQNYTLDLDLGLSVEEDILEGGLVGAAGLLEGHEGLPGQLVLAHRHQLRH